MASFTLTLLCVTLATAGNLPRPKPLGPGVGLVIPSLQGWGWHPPPTTTTTPPPETTGWPATEAPGWSEPITDPPTTPGWTTPPPPTTPGWTTPPPPTTPGWTEPPPTDGWKAPPPSGWQSGGGWSTEPPTSGWPSSGGWSGPGKLFLKNCCFFKIILGCSFFIFKKCSFFDKNFKLLFFCLVEIELESEVAVAGDGEGGATHGSEISISGDASNPAILQLNTGSYSSLSQGVGLMQVTNVNAHGESDSFQAVDGFNFGDSGEYLGGNAQGNQVNSQNGGGSFVLGQGVLGQSGWTNNFSGRRP